PWTVVDPGYVSGGEDNSQSIPWTAIDPGHVPGAGDIYWDPVNQVYIDPEGETIEIQVPIPPLDGGDNSQSIPWSAIDPEYGLDGGDNSDEYVSFENGDGLSPLEKAEKTLAQSSQVVRQFTIPQMSVNTREIEQMPISALYDFAKLYEVITYYEILVARGEFYSNDENVKLEHPEFLLTFIPIFYDMYMSNLTNYLNGNFHNCTKEWLLAFDLAQNATKDRTIDNFNISLKASVSAHIEGDMKYALVKAYKIFNKNHPDVSFDELHNDFFQLNWPVFKHVEGSFFTQLGRISRPFQMPFGMGALGSNSTMYHQFVMGVGSQKGFANMSLAEIFGWRQTAWDQAKVMNLK
nr:DUF5995 family protein [Bacteroidota bacterium]